MSEAALPGFISIFTVRRISGWAWNPAQPDAPIDVEIMDGTEMLFRIRADRFRPDLLQNGIGDGCHGFDLADLHHLVPFAGRTLTIRRAFDGTALLGSPGQLAPMAGPHLVLASCRERWFVSFGHGLYRLAAESAPDMAALLPLSVADPDDDALEELGEASLLEDGGACVLSLHPASDAAAIAIPLAEPDLASPTLRWCRGAPSPDCWVGSTISLEVENAAALAFTTYLGAHAGQSSKWIEIDAPGAQRREFELARGAPSTVAFRIAEPGRHRITMRTERESEHRQDIGFQLLRLEIMGHRPAEPA
jgi:hypothetical protein